MISISSSGSTSRTRKFLSNVGKMDFESFLHKAGEQGVAALRSATPMDTSLTANSWGYEIVQEDGSTTLSWVNRNRNGHVNIAVVLQYGHATGTGGWVAGRDYINPAIQPIMDRIAEDVWRKVKTA